MNNHYIYFSFRDNRYMFYFSYKKIIFIRVKYVFGRYILRDFENSPYISINVFKSLHFFSVSAIGPCHQWHVDETQAIITSSTPPHQISTTTPATTSTFNDNIITFGLQIFPSKPTYFTWSMTNTGDPRLRRCGERSWWSS